jgi:hypothetical protein
MKSSQHSHTFCGLNEKPRETLIKDYIATVLRGGVASLPMSLCIRIAIDMPLLLSFQSKTLSSQTTEPHEALTHVEQEHTTHVQKVQPNFGSSCGGNRVLFSITIAIDY